MRQTHQQQSRDAARASLYDDVTDRIIGELEAGCVPWVKPWEASGAALGVPRSAASRRAYSGINILILWDAVMRRGFASQEWLTFRQCQSLGGHVAKGEHGTTIFYADSFVPRAEREAANGPGEGEEPRRVPFLKRFTVFNVEQCFGLPAHIVAPPKPISPEAIMPAAEALIAASGVAIREGGGEAYYHPREDFIRLPPRDSFVSPADFYCTALHELTHATAHASRLNRDLQHRFGSSAYAREELIGTGQRLSVRASGHRAANPPCRLPRPLALRPQGGFARHLPCRQSGQQSLRFPVGALPDVPDRARVRDMTVPGRLDSEPTECGEQTLIPGVPPVTLRQRLALAQAQPLAPIKAQKPLNIGLFDEDARNQLSLF